MVALEVLSGLDMLRFSLEDVFYPSIAEPYAFASTDVVWLEKIALISEML